MRRMLVLFLFLFHFSFSQTVEVEYDLSIDMSGVNVVPFKHKFELINSQGKSLIKKHLVTKTSDKLLDKNDQQVNVVKIGNDTTYIFKEFDSNKLFSEEKIFINMYKVKDDLNIFDWVIENDSTTILGYKCYKAITKFRGRVFEAYFTIDIPISDGPGKYNGLPGLILKLSILNSTSIYEITAVRVGLKNENTKLNNPFEGKKHIEYNDYRKKYIQKYNEMDSFNANQGVTVVKSGLEILFNE